MEEKNPIQVSERIFHTIECLARTGPIGLLELSKELNLNKSTVHRILNSLICMEYAKQDAETLKYSLTFKFCGIANQISLTFSSFISASSAFPTTEQYKGIDFPTIEINRTELWEASTLSIYTAFRPSSWTRWTVSLVCSASSLM